mgnify:CR=1 FL=1
MADKRKTNSEKKQKSQAATLKEVICRLGRYRIFLVFSILLATVSVALTLYIPKLTGHAVDYVIGKGKVNFPGVIQVMIQIGVCTLITALAQWLMNVCNNKMTYQMVQDIRNEAFDKIEQLPLKYIDGHPYGEVVSRVIADVDQAFDGIHTAFYRNCYDCRNILFYVIRKCIDYICCGSYHTGIILCSKFYCKENISHVPPAI